MRKLLLMLSGSSLFGGLLLLVLCSGLNDTDIKTILIKGIIATLLMFVGYIGLKVNKWEYLDDEVM